MNERVLYHRAPDGVRLAVGAYAATGRGPVVLLLHGIASHMGWYRGIAELLHRRGVSVYLLDRRGVARSEGPRGDVRTWTVLADDVTDLAQSLEHRHRGQPLHVMGISLGSAVAVACALRNPGLFRSLVLLSPALASAVRMPLTRRVRTLARAVLAPSGLVDLPFNLDQMTANTAWRAALDADSRRTRRVSARFLLQVISLQRFIRRNIHQLGLPVLALFGGRDEIVDNATSIRLLGRIPCTTVRAEVFEAATHILAATVPSGQLADRILTWLDGDHGSVERQFSVLHTVLSHAGVDCAPPWLKDGPAPTAACPAPPPAPPA